MVKCYSVCGSWEWYHSPDNGWTWNVISKKEARALVDGGANLRPSSPLNGPSL